MNLPIARSFLRVMRFAPAVLPALASFAATPALACTVCHSPTALGVRHLVLEHDFFRNAAALATPIPLLLAAIIFAAREPRRGRTPR